MSKIITLLLLVSSLFSFSQEITPSKIIEDYIEAIGGREKLMKIKNIKISTLVRSKNEQGLNLKSNNIYVKPNKCYSKVEMKGNTYTEIINGNNGISIDLIGKTAVTTERIEAVHDDCYLFPHLYFKEWNYKMEILPNKIINNKECIGIKITRNNNIVYDYFDLTTKLLTQRESPSENYIITVLSYKSIDGILYMKDDETTTISDGLIYVTNRISIEFNANYDTSIFKL